MFVSGLGLRIAFFTIFGAYTGRLAGWLWALLPYAVYWPTRVVRDTSLTAFLLALAVLLTLRLGRAPSGLCRSQSAADPLLCSWCLRGE